MDTKKKISNSRKDSIDGCFSENVKDVYLDYEIPDYVDEARVSIPYNGGRMAIGINGPCIGCEHYRFLLTQNMKPGEPSHFCSSRNIAEYILDLNRQKAQRMETLTKEQKALISTPSASSYVN